MIILYINNEHNRINKLNAKHNLIKNDEIYATFLQFMEW